MEGDEDINLHAKSRKRRLQSEKYSDSSSLAKRHFHPHRSVESSGSHSKEKAFEAIAEKLETENERLKAEITRLQQRLGPDSKVEKARDDGFTSDETMFSVWLSQHILPALTCAVQLKTFEAISRAKGGALSATEIQKSCKMNQRGSIALLSVLESLELLYGTHRPAENHGQQSQHKVWLPGDIHYALTALSDRFLVESSPFHWLGPLLSTMTNTCHSRLLAALTCDEKLSYDGDDTSVTGGLHESCPSAAVAWETGSMSQHQASAITKMMHRLGTASARALAKKVTASKLLGFIQDKFSPKGPVQLLDIGGGSGVYSTQLLQATIADLPVVCSACKKGNYCPPQVRFFAFDMFKDPWPEGHQVHLLSNVLHDWGPEKSEHILRNSHRTLESGGCLVIHEMLISTTDGRNRGGGKSEGACAKRSMPGLAERRSFPINPASAFSPSLTASCFGLHMLLYTRFGRQFYLEELTSILRKVGFKVCGAAALCEGCKRAAEADE
eukprot:jgi/Bigna1/78082/fgenesh1_pg.52_\